MDTAVEKAVRLQGAGSASARTVAPVGTGIHDGFWTAVGQTAPGDAASLGTRFAWFCAAAAEASPEGVPPGGIAQVLLMAMVAGLGLPLASGKGVPVGGALSAALSARAASTAMTVAGVERADEVAVLAAIKAVWRGSSPAPERKGRGDGVSGALLGDDSDGDGQPAKGKPKPLVGDKPTVGRRRRGGRSRGTDDSDEGDAARKTNQLAGAGKLVGGGERRGDRGRGTPYKAVAPSSDEGEAPSETEGRGRHANMRKHGGGEGRREMGRGARGGRGAHITGRGALRVPAAGNTPFFIPEDELYDEEGVRRCRFHAAEPDSCTRPRCSFSHKPPAKKSTGPGAKPSSNTA